MPDNHLTIHDLPESERPRERLLKHGAQTLSDTELLAIILRTGTHEENVLNFAARLIAAHDGLAGLAKVSADQLIQIKGLGRAKAAQILAALELGRRAMSTRIDDRPTIHSSADAAALVQDMKSLSQEQVRVILLDSSNRVIALPTIYIGTVNMSILRISELYREAIVRNSPAIIIAHNHPSGDPAPSPEDIELTRAMITAGELLDIQLIDHLIIGQNGWKSMRDMGLGFHS